MYKKILLILFLCFTFVNPVYSETIVNGIIQGGTGSGSGSPEVYGSGWNGDTTMPEKNDIYDYLHQIDTNDNGSLADEAPLMAKQDNLVYSETVGGCATCLDAKDGDDIAVNDIAFVSKSVQVDAGTTDGTTASKLVDSMQNLLTTASIGDVVNNTTNGTYAAVTAVDSDTQLSLSADIMTTGEAYTISSWWMLQYQATLSNKTEDDPVVVAPDTNRNNKTWERQNWWKNGVLQLNELKVPTSDDPDLTVTGQISFDVDGWIRGTDDNGTTQFALGRKIEAIHVTVVKPQDMADAVRDAFLVWSNESGMSFIITGWKGWSGTDDTTLNIETTAADGSGNATVDAVEIATGAGPFTASDTTITAATIANGSLLWLDFDDTDDPSYVKLTIYGYYDANVN